MKCQAIAGEQIAERYVSGQLDEGSRDEFELHILECPTCLSSVETLQELREAVASQAHQIRLAPERPSSRLWYWSFAAASLVLILAAGVLQWRKHQASGPTPQIALQQPPVAETPVAPVTTPSQPETTVLQPAPVTKAPVPEQKARRENPPQQHRQDTPAEIASTQPVAPPEPNSQPITQAPVQSAASSTPSAQGRRENPKKQPELTSDQALELYRVSEVRPAPFTFAGFKPDPGHARGLSAMQGGAGRDSASSNFQRAMTLYIEGNYHDAESILERAAESEPGAPNINFYLGVCKLMLGRPDEAIPSLSQVAKNPQSRLVQPAHIYMAKAYLQKADLKSAQSELETAAALAGPMKGEASALLQRVRALRTGVESSSATAQ